MVSVFDVAAYILHRHGSMTTMKLQKLVYYAQAWSLVWDEAPLFREKIRAWANGPVVPELFFSHQGDFVVKSEPKGDRKKLDSTQKETVDAILKHYGGQSGQWLSVLTHREKPWRKAREGLSDGERGNAEITLGAMANYYGNI
ncbi:MULTISPECIES: type II toxin-antitoxin system antitoxin SocA domain-containing protein [unclassified Mesorhizobium]|uniref:Panacea domain-containing protein n=1 Tax=unclassified Mesorhizobium TaxID=325217 RepID=UPI0033376F90